MNFSMTDSHVFMATLHINSMNCTFRHRYFRPTENRGFVHVNPHTKKVSGSLEFIVRVKRTPELGSWLTKIIHPYALARPTFASVRKASSLSIFDKNLYAWYLSPIFEHKTFLHVCCLTPYKIKVVVGYVWVCDCHKMSLRFFNFRDHFLKRVIIELDWIENEIHCVLSIEKVKPEGVHWELMLIEFIVQVYDMLC